MTPIEYYEYFKKDLAPLSDDAIIARFNQSVGLRAFGVARQGYLKALRASLDERNIDYSAGVTIKPCVLIGRYGWWGKRPFD